MFPPDAIPPAWAILLATVPLLSLLALLHLRRVSGSIWLQWDRVPCPPWRLADILGISFLAAASVYLAYPASPAVVILGALWLAQARGFDLWQAWRLGRDQIHLRDCLLLYLACLLPIGLVAALSSLASSLLGLEDLIQGPVREILESEDSAKVAFYLTAAILIAPIWEEVVFRGILYPYCKARFGRWPGLAATSLLFGAIHFHLPSLLPLALLGLVLGLAYERTGSLWSPILLHALFNLGTAINLLVFRLHEATG